MLEIVNRNLLKCTTGDFSLVCSNPTCLHRPPNDKIRRQCLGELRGDHAQESESRRCRRGTIRSDTHATQTAPNSLVYSTHYTDQTKCSSVEHKLETSISTQCPPLPRASYGVLKTLRCIVRSCKM